MTTRQLWLFTCGVTAVGLAVVFSTFGDYGITWDDPTQAHYGEGVLRYFTSGFEDSTINDFLYQRFYGPLFELIAALVYAGAPEAKYEIRRLLIGLSGLVAVIGVIRVGALLPGRFVPLLAPLALVALPRFYGHAFTNSKDIPFSAAFVWAVYAICRFASRRVDDPSRRWPTIVGCGAALGATLALRPGGMPVLLLVFGAVVGAGLLSRGELRRDRIRSTLARSALAGGIAWAIAWIFMIALWPWAHQDPIGNPVRAVLAALASPFKYPVLFEGAVTMSNELPRTYLARYLLITTPLEIGALAIVGLVAGSRDAWRDRTSAASLAFFAVGLWWLAPLLLATLSHPNVYDGIRHFLFTLPPLALMAALGVQKLADAAAGLAERTSSPASRLQPRTLAAATAAGLALVMASSLTNHVALHPYQTTYFNGTVGGVAGAEGRYETDYWLGSYREAMEWVNARAVDEQREIRVLVAADPYSRDCAAAFAGPGVSLMHTAEKGLAGAIPEPFDYYVATTRYGLHGNFPDAPVAHRVGREGAVFTWIRGREPLPERSLAERHDR